MDEMKNSMKILQEENEKLRRELEQVKNRIDSPKELNRENESEKTQRNKEAEKDKKKDKKKMMSREKGTIGTKRLHLLSVTSIESRNSDPSTRSRVGKNVFFLF